MNNNIQVTADGFVHIGRNEFVSLEAIQQAVLRATNPGLNVNCPEGSPPTESKGMKKVTAHLQRLMASAKQEHLELPSTAPPKQKPNKPSPTFNEVFGIEECLPLPTTMKR